MSKAPNNFTRRRGAVRVAPAVGISAPAALLPQGFLLAALGTDVAETPESRAEDLDPHQFLSSLDLATFEVADNALAEATRRSYTWHVSRWAQWCRSADTAPENLDPDTVRKHLAAMAAVLTETGEVARDEDGKPLRGQLRPVTLEQRMQALNKLAEQLGVPRPGDDHRVAQVMRGIRRMWGTTPEEQKAALTMNEVRRLLAVIDAVPYERLRDRAILVLSRAGSTPGQLAALRWANVGIRHDHVCLDLQKPTRSPGSIAVKLARARDVRVCPVESLRDLRDASAATCAVFLHNGRAMTRQGIAAIIRRAAGGQALSDTAFAALVAPTFEPSLLQIRNRAIILTGWYCALRRSNIAAASWRDLRREAGEWELVLPVTKSNSEGGKDPDRNWISLSDDAAWPCAATALYAWHAALAGALGVDPMEMRRSEPLFPAMDRHNNVRLRASGRMLRFDGEAVNELVQNLCGKAGLDANRYGAHSLRAGFVTEALTDNKLTVAEVQEVTHHKTVDVLLGYNRRVNARKSNPTKKLWGRPQAVA